MMKDKNALTEEEFLKNYEISNFERPSVSVDDLIFAIDEVPNDDIRKLNEKRLQVLLIKRDEHPFIDMWSLPGAFVGFHETLEEASLRCLEEKAKLNDIYLEQLYTFGDIERDPRTRVLSTSYMGLVDKKVTTIKGDNENTAWFTLKTEFNSEDDIYEMTFDNENGVVIKSKILVKDDKITILENKNLAFDHAKIILYGLLRMRNKLEYTDIAFSMLASHFTMAELQQVYEVILDKKLTKANFQRKIKDKVEASDEYKTGGFRPAKLYRYKKND